MSKRQNLSNMFIKTISAGTVLHEKQEYVVYRRYKGWKGFKWFHTTCDRTEPKKVYPWEDGCVGCGKPLKDDEELICISCTHQAMNPSKEDVEHAIQCLEAQQN